MKAAQKISIGALLAVALLIGYLALRNRQPPFMPRDADHVSFTSGEDCLSCHGPQGNSPRKKTHPLGNDCTRCHGWN